MGRVCEMCPENTAKPATVFCAADACFLCQACDVIVHSANRLARRHVRRAIGQSEMTDGSSIDDDSETALVPDVSTLTCPDVPSGHVDEPLPSEDALLTALPQEGPVSFEDTAEYDFCDFVDDGLGAKMPALCAIDDDNIFADNKGLGRSLYGEMSWESVVPEHIEHVVPDVSELSVSVRTGVPAATREPKENDMGVTRKVLSAPSAASFVQKTGKSKVRIAAVPVARSNTAVTAERNVDTKKEATTSSTTKGNSTVGKKRSRDEQGETASSDHTTVEKPADSVSEVDGVAKSAEQRKKRRAEALARFRSKRANRSFTKKVRYECRKQLADSRPRVKGRFVRKIEMALFRKYGALYRDHLDELEPVPGTLTVKIANESADSIGDQRVPAL